MLVIGITGGIGSGKSEICTMFRSMGVVTLIADIIAKIEMERNDELREHIRQTFGADAYTTDEKLNVKFLSDTIFSNEEKVQKLNALVHPAVRNVLEAKIRYYEKELSASYIIIEAALIFEASMNDLMDYILVVDADEELRIKRALARGGLSREEIVQRMKTQMPPDEKKKYADFVLENNGTKEELQQRVNFFHSLFSTLKPA